MSFIQFESGRVKDAAREALRKSREAVLAKAEADHYKRQRQQEQAKLRGEDQWILPSVESRLNADKKSEKKGKKADKKKKSKKKKKHRSKSSSQSSDTTSEEEWVEKDHKPSETPDLVAQSKIPETSVVRDEWMTLPGLFPCVNSTEEREARKQRKKEKNDKGTIDQLGQSDRELNPYWKNGGTGLPTARQENTETNTTPDQSKNDEQSRKLVRVATSKLDIEQRDENEQYKNNRSYEAPNTRMKRYQASEYKSHGRDSASSSSSKTRDRNKQRSRSRSNSRDRGSSRKQSRDDNRYRSRSRSRETKRHYQDKFNSERKSAFKKPGSDDFASTSYSSSNNSLSRSKNWRKPNTSSFENESSRVNVSEKESSRVNNPDEKLSENHCAQKRTVCTERMESPIKDETETDAIMTEAEMNQLGAKIVKCEIMGDNEMASQLKAKLEKAREARKNTISNTKEEETAIILTKTDSRGMTKPIEPRSAYEEPKGGRRNRKKINTHESGQRVRYFADDDKFSIHEMFQQEKGQSTNDDAAAFVKAASKGMDMDEIFEDRVRFDENESKQDERDRSRAIKAHKKMSNSLDNCRLCVDSRQMLKHMIVAMGNKVYMSLPSHESLTTGHCILAPIHHVTCQTLLDEDVWDELQTFKKTLTKMFQDQDEDVIFFEISIGHRYFPHMQLECIPVPKETGDLAPIYFKKALLECEMEWSMNKKVIDLGGKNIQQAVPKGLAYFTVDFGMQPGFAHVIEDEKLFPRTFAQEIIGGMLDLDRNVWRKPRRQNFDQQRSKVIEFASIWKKYDFTTGDDDSD